MLPPGVGLPEQASGGTSRKECCWIRRHWERELGNIEIARPRPSADMLKIMGLDRFAPAPELEQWIREAYLDEDGPLYYEGHSHLEDAAIGCLWTTAENSRHGRRIVGQAEMPLNSLGRLPKWLKARCYQQLREWFHVEPDFLLTFDVYHADAVDDATFCSLVDHELAHCGQATDEFGMPKFDKMGKPKWAIRGHDVEEFVSVVRRFGIEAAGAQATELVIAAAQKPEIGPAKLAYACGTCLRVAA